MKNISLSWIIPHEMPRSLQWAVTLLHRYGLNPYGSPNLRLVFSPTVPRIIGGYWNDHGVLEYRLNTDKRTHWLLEKWFPARFWGDPVNWIKNSMTPEGFLSNGPYPYRGKYLEVFRFETVPDPGLLMFSARQAQIAQTRTKIDIRRRLEQETDAQKAETDRNMDDFLAGVRMGRFQVGSSGRMDDPDEKRFWEIRKRMEDKRMWRDKPKSKFSQGRP